MQHFGLTLCLRDDASKIAEYRRQHEAVWPGVLARLRECGVHEMPICAERVKTNSRIGGTSYTQNESAELTLKDSAGRVVGNAKSRTSTTLARMKALGRR